MIGDEVLLPGLHNRVYRSMLRLGGHQHAVHFANGQEHDVFRLAGSRDIHEVGM